MDYTNWTIARLREGASCDTINVEQLNGLGAEFLGVCRTLNGGDRRAAFDEWTAHHPHGADIRTKIFEIYPAPEEFPKQKKNEMACITYVALPELPKSGRLTAAQERAATDTGEWIQQYVDHASQIVNTIPRHFSESAALSIVSVAIMRRVMCPTFFEDIYPNIWTLWVAESTIFHKTTALNIARRLIRATMPHALLPEEQTGDRLVQEMAAVDPTNLAQMTMFDQELWRKKKINAGQRSIVIDEASSLFNGFRRDFNVGKVETLLKAYDCDPHKEFTSIKHGTLILRYLYLSFLGATTPVMVQSAANMQMWQNGFWVRFIPLVPDKEFPDPIQYHDELIHRPKEIDEKILFLLEKLPKVEPSISVDSAPPAPPFLCASFDKDVWQAWMKYNDAMSYDLQREDVMPDNRLRYMYGRMPVKLIKVATLLATLDWDGDGAPRIRMSHYAKAHQICEVWRLNAHQFIKLMDTPLEAKHQEQQVLTVIGQLNQRGIVATSREIYRSTGWARERVNALLADMQGDGLLEGFQAGRAQAWKVVTE